MNERAPLLSIAVCLIIGIIIGDSLSETLPLFPFLCALLVVALLLRRHPLFQSLAIGGCVVLLGMVLVTASPSSPSSPSRLDRSRTTFLNWRGQLLDRYRAGGLSDEDYAVVAAMTLGDRSALSKELRETYSQTGAAHVLALSGLHLSIIYTLLSFLVVGRRRRVLTQLLLITAIWAFAFLTGLSASVVRASVMLTVYALLSLGHRNRMSVNVLAFTAIVMLLVSPYTLFDIGFQLSFMAVLAILLLYPHLQRVFPADYLQRHPAVRWLWGMVSVSLAAQVGVAPLVAYYFGRFPTYFLLTNFLVIPAATLILYLSIIVLLWPSLAFLLLYIVTALNRALAWVAALPLSSIEGLHPSVLQVVMTYILLAALLTLIWKSGALLMEHPRDQRG